MSHEMPNKAGIPPSEVLVEHILNYCGLGGLNPNTEATTERGIPATHKMNKAPKHQKKPYKGLKTTDYISQIPPKYITQPYEIDFTQLMQPMKVERKSKAQMGGALGLYYPSQDTAVIDDLLYGEAYSEVWVHEGTHRDNGASEQNVRERTKYRVGDTHYH